MSARPSSVLIQIYLDADLIATSTAELLARADDALLTAKAIGGDVVIDSHYETSRHE